MRVLFIGDIFAKAGRRAVVENLVRIIKEEKVDFVCANAENASHGRSLTAPNYEELIKAGVDMITMGNHTWDTSTIYELLRTKERIIRPYNVKPASREDKAGVGSVICDFKGKKIQITNLMSMQCSTKATMVNPFIAMEEILKKSPKPDIHIVDFHAETTSEKNAFLMSFAGKVSLIVCTHTHVQTSDEKIYKNTAYITDLGMTGPKESIIGCKPDELIQMFRGERPHFHLDPARGTYQFNSVIVDFDDKTNKPTSIRRYNINQN